MAAADKREFNNLPTAYLRRDLDNSSYTLYVSVQLEAGQQAVPLMDPVFDALGFLQHVAFQIEMSSGPSGVIPTHFETFEYPIPAATSEASDEVLVEVTDINGKKRTVIVHHEDADVPD